jgi:putative phage-type endonuclease
MLTGKRRAEWLALRRSGIGGSDAAAILGLSKRKTATHVWAEKVGVANKSERPADERMRMGLRLEKSILQEYAARVRCSMVYPSSKGEVLRHQLYDFMVGSLDAIASKGSTRWVVDAKNVDRMFAGEWGDDGSGNAPEDLTVQLLHYMIVGGFDKGDFAALIGGNELRIITIHRDDKLMKRICEVESEFWNEHVLKGIPPTPDFEHPAAAEVIKILRGNIVQKTIALSPTHHLARVVEAHRIGGLLEAKGAALKRAAKNEVAWLMGDATDAQVEGTGVSFTRRLVKKKAYTVEPSEYIDTRIKLPKDLKLDDSIDIPFVPTAITTRMIGDSNDSDVIDIEAVRALAAAEHGATGGAEETGNDSELPHQGDAADSGGAPGHRADA